MKGHAIIYSAVAFVLLAGSFACKKQPVFSLLGTVSNEIIAIQPLDEFDCSSLVTLANEISAVYRRRVCVLPPVKVPLSFLDPGTNRYDADSILHWLSNFQNDSIAEIIGLTSHAIFTTREMRKAQAQDDRIFGAGYEPGNTCLVSDFRFRGSNRDINNRRLRNVIIHEVGHNLGLPHCPDNACIMSAENGRYENLDRPNTHYCNNCEKSFLEQPVPCVLF